MIVEGHGHRVKNRPAADRDLLDAGQDHGHATDEKDDPNHVIDLGDDRDHVTDGEGQEAEIEDEIGPKKRKIRSVYFNRFLKLLKWYFLECSRENVPSTQKIRNGMCCISYHLDWKY